MKSFLVVGEIIFRHLTGRTSSGGRTSSLNRKKRAKTMSFFRNNWISSEITICRLQLYSWQHAGESLEKHPPLYWIGKQLREIPYSGLTSLLGNTRTNFQFTSASILYKDACLGVMRTASLKRCFGLNRGIQLHYQGDLPHFKSVSPPVCTLTLMTSLHQSQYT